MDAVVAACLFPLALFILLNALDDAVLDALVGWHWLRARLFPDAVAGNASAEAAPEKRVAIFVPLWHEHQVIRGMVEHNVAAIRYRHYDFFIGAYPNDKPTLDAVRELEGRFDNVHLAVCAHDGPTSKADCLNWIYQHMLLFEEKHGVSFDLVVTHDAEDLIHADSLSRINEHADRYGMVQIPVLPLATPLRDWVHGIYCDEFAEYQTKDIPARQILGAFLPSNGVGTGYSRAALEKLACTSGNQVFNPVCLTEDYENGMRLHRHGFAQKFVPLTGGAGAVATREYFPRRLRSAIRQRTRWITGISLQSWELNGWSGGLVQGYWFWRDRKGLVANPAGLLSNLLLCYGLATWIAAHVSGGVWGLAHAANHPALFVAIVVLQVFHMTVRMACVTRYFGWRFALGVPIRVLLANYINGIATMAAEFQFFRAKLRHQPLVWLKTEHAFPSRAALLPHKPPIGELLIGARLITPEQLKLALASQPPGFRIGEYLVRLGLIQENDLYRALAVQQGLTAGYISASDVNPRIARALPRFVIRQWKVLPVRVHEGSMILASPEVPCEELQWVLQPLTSLTVQFHLVTPENFAELTAGIA